MKNRLIDWLKNHDERWSFILLYAGGAVVLSIYMSLFWVAMLMLVHLFLELMRHVSVRAPLPVLHSLWHVKLDIGLLLFALVVALYADTVMALLGLGQAARATQAVRGVQMATRFGIIERSMRVVLLTIDDVGLLLRGALKGVGRGRGATVSAPAHLSIDPAAEAVHPWQDFSIGDRLSLGFGLSCAALILLAPALTGMGGVGVAETLLGEMTP